MPIGFNKPYLTGRETEYIGQAVASEKISGDGMFTMKCHAFFEERYGFKKTLLTSSCTDALEMAAILGDLQPGDEVIAPSYTFVSSVNAFVLRGAKIVFADSCDSHPCMDAAKIEAHITSRTRAIVVVHYAGVACDMDVVLAVARKYKLIVIEDAAQAIDSFYKGAPLGSFGQFGTISFHETKNVMAGEGGLLVVNDSKFFQRAEIIREKGTNRSAFFRGEVDKYNWVDIGSSFLPSEITAAFLFAQLENLDNIQDRRKAVWRLYDKLLEPLRKIDGLQMPFIPHYATNNAHMYYLVCRTSAERKSLINHLHKNDIQAVSHYISLHQSPFYTRDHREVSLVNSERYSSCLVRLPFYYELKDDQVGEVASSILRFFRL